MSYKGQTAFVTGGASGIARALTQRLVDKGARVFIADINTSEAESFVSELNNRSPDAAFCAKCDVNSWDDLVSAFTKAMKTFDRIDYVFPIAGLTERQVIPKPSEQKDVRKHGFVKPDTMTLNVNMNGMLNLIMIAVQAFRGQEPKEQLGGMRGKLVCVSSTCGLYPMPGVPVYVASKHAIAGLVRSYGNLILPKENITLNAICPHVVRTGISKHTPWFYDDLEKGGLLTEIGRVIDGFEEFLGESTRSAECLEVGPKGKRVVGPEEYMDDETRLGVDAATVRSGRLWMD